MFWKFNNPSTSELETLLTKEGITLKEILEQDDVIQECKNQNKKLIEYLCQNDVLAELITLITSEPPADLDAAVRFKSANTAAELLSCEVQQINEKVGADETLLEQLYSFVTQPAPLNPLLASFFSRTFSVLVTRKSEQNWYSYQYMCMQVFEFFKKKEFVNDLLRHIGTSSISDLILKLVTGVEGKENKQGLLEWLNEKHLVQCIIGLLDHSHDRDIHDNASRLLIEMLRCSRDFTSSERPDRDPLLETMEAEETIEALLGVILSAGADSSGDAERAESSIVNGVAVLMALLETRTAISPTSAMAQGFTNAKLGPSDGDGSPEAVERTQRLEQAAIKTVLPRINELTELLKNPPKKSAVTTTVGVLDPPFGAARLSIVKLICTLLAARKADINERLLECKTVDILLDLFFKYSLNNFLHSQVELCLTNIIEWRGPEEEKSVQPDAAIQAGDSEQGSTKVEESEATTKLEGEENTGRTEELPEEAKNDEVMETEEKASGEEQMLKSGSNPLLLHLVTECRLLERIAEAFKYEEVPAEPETRKILRSVRGYLGHLTRIANTLVHHSKVEEGSAVSGIFSGLPDELSSSWDEFVAGSLAQTNAKNTIVPPASYNGSGHSGSNCDDDDSDFRDLSFSHDSAAQQLFADYRGQRMSDQLVESFNFEDEDFNSGDDGIGPPVCKEFGISGAFEDEDEEDQKQDHALEMFESECKQRLGSLDDEEEDDLWADKTKEIAFVQKQPTHENLHQACSPVNNSHSSSDEEGDENRVKSKEIEEEGEKNMDVDERADEDDWDLRGSSAVPTAMDTGNPWDQPQPQEAEASEKAGTPSSEAFAAFGTNEEAQDSVSGGWADFSESKDASQSLQKETVSTSPPAEEQAVQQH